MADKATDTHIIWPKVFLFGDSITQQSFSAEGCWGSLLADHLIRRCDVVNRGFSGYNVKFCRLILPSLLDKKTAGETVAMTIFLGANDSNDAVLNPGQHYPLEDYKKGLKEMIEFAEAQGISREKIILITPPAVSAEDWNEDRKKIGGTLDTHDNAVTKKYAEACLQVADEMGTKKVDIYSSMMEVENYRSLLRDGLHFSAAGSHRLFDLLKPVIDSLTSHLPDILLSSLDGLDPDNLKESLLKSKSADK